jgi:hypothetical protein
MDGNGEAPHEISLPSYIHTRYFEQKKLDEESVLIYILTFSLHMTNL